ncbi:nucleotidyl transferase AbiEii/AbiGii toxin family protein [Patescibacteria group bacterium]|nr:nucleotidyl transferase AbiEii/AbiGii toxin family protein [Patescibacteria group bacterium]MBU1473057.1 nucleotidyl transferase AbiEii/AbiGii toxin family protein [Patescibacteria group bacterium]MBU2460187.1 nucleotidyl transferase AbiEii/AbiGii toxin family protein [Patescibacteria group bacterium]MBU2543926.1 nucleotidyl transferase AbiEii/AbiGii toxin family protein [Patescibacteria group bacterium]
MGKNSILKRHHKKFLELVVNEPYIRKRFYWTGGTVLSEFYLHHRESEDIDLFSEHQEIHIASINKFVALAGKKLGAKEIAFKRYLGLYSYVFQLPHVQLKVDFNYYPFPRIQKGGTWKGLEIDSLEDITANKIHTIYTHARDRDFVDLFFIMKDKDFDLKKMISLAKAKIDWHIDPIQLGQTFTQVVVLKDIPRMIVPFDRHEMEKFFLEEAKKLQSDIFKA